MTEVLTWEARTARARASRRAAVAALQAALPESAAALGVRYIIYGSTARGEDRPESDVDILVDAAGPARSEACLAAEAACRGVGLSPDVRPIDYASPTLIARARAEAIMVP
jgi:predicted nucleotidyltransferase